MAVRLGGSALLQAWKSHESQCLWCKKVFLHTDEHAYKGCCSWGCLCRMRENEENSLRSNRRAKSIVRTEAQALTRIAVCKEKIAYYERVGASTVVNRRTKKTANRALWEWRMKLQDADRTLRILRGENVCEDEYSVW